MWNFLFVVRAPRMADVILVRCKVSLQTVPSMGQNIDTSGNGLCDELIPL